MRHFPVMVAVCVAVALVVTQTACSPDPAPPYSPPDDPTTEVTTPAVAPTFETLWTDPQYCHEDWPVPMGMVPETAEEQEVLSYLAVCTTEPTTGFPDGKGFYIKNHDDTAVWILDKPFGLEWTHPEQQPMELRVYREEIVPPLGIVGLTLEPGKSVTNDDEDPMDIHMHLDAQAQGAWQFLDLGIETAQAKGYSGLARVQYGAAANTGTQTVTYGPAIDMWIGPNSPTRPVAITCSIQAGKGALSILEERSNSNSDFWSRTTLGLGLAGNATECGQAYFKAKATPGFGSSLTPEQITVHSKIYRGASKFNSVLKVLSAGAGILSKFHLK